MLLLKGMMTIGIKQTTQRTRKMVEEGKQESLREQLNQARKNELMCRLDLARARREISRRQIEAEMWKREYELASWVVSSMLVAFIVLLFIFLIFC